MRAALKWIAASAALAVLLGLAAALVWIYGSLPQSEGSLRLPGLRAPVEIVRDAHGIPHIRAESSDDAYFALGFVHAQDRLWQMDFLRRAGAGRLSEILGETLVPHDRFLRTLGLGRLAERNFAHLDRDVRAALVAYAGGVNAFIDGHRGAWPPEFHLLRYRPEPWRPADSLVWGRLMTLRLSGNWTEELLRARLLRRLAPDEVAELWPPYPDDAPRGVTGDDVSELSTLYERLPLDELRAALPADLKGLSASNNWVVAGPHTASGRPVLANDVHLRLEIPAVWYLARIEAPGLKLAGATVPGFPFLVLGHNGRVAWGFTTTHSDTQDLFIERIDGADPGRYLTPDGPRPFSVREEAIAVRGGDEVQLTVRESRHGPIISDVVTGTIAAAPEAEGGGEFVIALADAALRDHVMSAQALYRMNLATDWSTFVAALEDFHAPQQNIVYADVDGHIGFYAPARVPVRKAGDGLRPVPGWSGAYDWTGFVPFRELPHVLDPASGRIVTANHRIVGDDYPHLLAARWPEPYRARRIHSLLDRHVRHSPGAAAAFQADVVSLPARDLLDLLLAVPAESARAKAARAMLARWEGKMERARPEPLVFSAWLRELNRALYADELGPLFDDVWDLRPLLVEAVLRRAHHWCDDVTTREAESCGDMVALSLERAVSHLSDTLGEDMEAWRWGRLHVARFRHPVLRRVPGLRLISDLAIATDGDDATINRGSFRVAGEGPPFAHIHGPVLRAIYDLAHLDESRFMIVPGQSGNPLSAHYRDLLEPWRDGEYVRLPGREAGAGPASGSLVLLPAEKD
jgi:penicillin amidase